MQGEWDNLMLETFSLKEHLNVVRHELSHALYQHDAACRVISRLITERDEAYSRLAMTQERLREFEASHKAQEEETKMDEKNQGIYKALLEKMKSLFQRLTEKRSEKRKGKKEILPIEKMSKLEESGCFPIHSVIKPEIMTMDIHPLYDHLIITGGKDKNAILFDKETAQVKHTFTHHKKAITQVRFTPTPEINAVFCSNDKTVSIWNCNLHNNHFKLKHVINDLNLNVVTSCCIHPLNDYCVFAGDNAKWSFYNINTVGNFEGLFMVL
jgi:pre-mRNA-processing factor 19